MLGLIGKYKVEREVGHGGFGKVYLAFDPDVGQPVAIKKLLAGGDPDLLKRFLLEIRTTASLRHKNIVTIYSSGEEAGDPYLVMEFLEGQTLKYIIQQQRPLTLLDKVRILTQVAEGLAYAHSKGVVHRDVKPENIMLLPDDSVKVMDFGIALAPNRNTSVTQTGGIIGTPPYFAPEQLQGHKANEQTDIFSFGDVCYELLAGVHPFEQYKGDWKSLQIAILSYRPRPISELVPGCPEALESLVHRSLAKEPEFRYSRFEDIRLDCEAILADLKHEGAAALLREARSLVTEGNLAGALAQINQAYQLDPGNREVRRQREEIQQLVQREQVRARAAKLLADASVFMSQCRFAEAVECLELAARLDAGDAAVKARLEEARIRQDRYVRTNSLISEARFLQQGGRLAEAEDRLRQALALDADHDEGRRLLARVREDLGLQARERQRLRAIELAQEQRAARRFEEALALLEAAERELSGGEGLAELHAQILKEKIAEDRRLRWEQFNLEVAKTREIMNSGDLESTRTMVDRLDASFAKEPGTAEVLRDLHGELDALVRAREIVHYQQRVCDLLEENSLPGALALLLEATGKFPDDEDLKQLSRRAQTQSSTNEADTSRPPSDLDAAFDIAQRGQKEQRYHSALPALLDQWRHAMAAGRYDAAVEMLEAAGQFRTDPEIEDSLSAARSAAARSQEARAKLDCSRISERIRAYFGEGDLQGAEKELAEARGRYPNEAAWAGFQADLEGRQRWRRHQASSAAIQERDRQAIGGGDPEQATATVSEPQAKYPSLAAWASLDSKIAAPQVTPPLTQRSLGSRLLWIGLSAVATFTVGWNLFWLESASEEPVGLAFGGLTVLLFALIFPLLALSFELTEALKPQLTDRLRSRAGSTLRRFGTNLADVVVGLAIGVGAFLTALALRNLAATISLILMGVVLLVTVAAMVIASLALVVYPVRAIRRLLTQRPVPSAAEMREGLRQSLAAFKTAVQVSLLRPWVMENERTLSIVSGADGPAARRRFTVGTAAAAVILAIALVGAYAFLPSGPPRQGAGKKATAESGGAPAPETKAAVSPPAPLPVAETSKPETAIEVQTKVNPKDRLNYAWIPPGTFQMGCSPDDSECDIEEKPAHQVTFTKGFWMGQTPVTQAAYQRLMGTNQSHYKGTEHPVDSVSWDDAQAYCRAAGGRLPSEAEWEYAARGGTTGARYGQLAQIAWSGIAGSDRTREVGKLQANAFGLSDMLGNVWQWTCDGYADYRSADQLDPVCSTGGRERAIRGGSWEDPARTVRASVRRLSEPRSRYFSVGFRCMVPSLPNSQKR